MRSKYAYEVTSNDFKPDSISRKDESVSAKEPDKPIRISGKTVEEVGFGKIREILADLQELKIVLLDGMCMYRPQSRKLVVQQHGLENEIEDDIKNTSPKIMELDLSRNLFEEWGEIVSICAQLPQLRGLRIE